MRAAWAILLLVVAVPVVPAEPSCTTLAGVDRALPTSHTVHASAVRCVDGSSYASLRAGARAQHTNGTTLASADAEAHRWSDAAGPRASNLTARLWVPAHVEVGAWAQSARDAEGFVRCASGGGVIVPGQALGVGVGALPACFALLLLP